MSTPSPIVPPFTADTAYKKVKIAQDLWNTKTPEKVALAYTVRSCTISRFIKFAAGDADVWHNMTYLQEDTVWRNRDCFMHQRKCTLYAMPLRSFLRDAYVQDAR